MNLDYTAIIVGIIGVLTTGGFWNYLQNKTKLNQENRRYESQANLEFRESLKNQVRILNEKVDKLVTEKEELLLEMAIIQRQLAEANLTIVHLQEYLRNHNTHE